MQQYLIAHKVRGERAFDIASKIKCPVCEPIRQGLDVSSPGCEDCDGEGNWWIVCTSGHRAFPDGSWALDELADISDYPHQRPMEIGEPDETLPEHYQVSAAKGEGKVTARDLLKNLIKREPIERRGL